MAPSRTASERPSQSPAASSPQPVATARPSASVDPPADAGAWVRADSFEADPGSTYVVDVAAWDRGFVAVGSSMPDKNVMAGPEMPAIWTSSDGTAWESQPVDLRVSNVSLIGIAPVDDGAAVLAIATTSDAYVEGSQPGAMRSYSWISDDGVAWDPVDFGLPADTVVTSFDHGPQGYALAANGGVWYSTDGRNWEETLEDEVVNVVAGEEGFVAIPVREAQAERAAVASADGRSWFDADPVDGTVVSVAPINGDWLAVVQTDDLGFTIWHSANGLEWNPVLGVDDLTGPDGPKTGRGLEYDSISGVVLAGAAGAGEAFITLTGNHCCAQLGWNLGVYSTTDGRTWSPVASARHDDAGGALVASIAVGADGTAVLGGHIGRGDDALFWIGQR
ncbi:MAG TPA: hypothetical protein VFV59_06395 [Candidatus Limnocylindria bacterium]|nr:hypothetical protein [Candidatus Limnocylindria bacterium]